MFKMMALHGALVGVTLKIGALTKLGLFFPMVCSIYVFHHTAEQLYRDKGLNITDTPASLFDGVTQE